MVNIHTRPTQTRQGVAFPQQGHGQERIGVYPLERTVRRIRSTKSVRAAELVRRPGPR